MCLGWLKIHKKSLENMHLANSTTGDPQAKTKNV